MSWVTIGAEILPSSNDRGAGCGIGISTDPSACECDGEGALTGVVNVGTGSIGA